VTVFINIYNAKRLSVFLDLSKKPTFETAFISVAGIIVRNQDLPDEGRGRVLSMIEQILQG
jgi:hypothetical protein